MNRTCINKSRVALLITSLLLVCSGCTIITGKNVVVIEADEPVDFPETGFSHALFEDLLETYVDVEGNVSYDEWHQSSDDIAALNSYLAAVSRYSPDNAPGRFESRNDELAYWLYSYNAYVIKSILHRWPLDSVRDVKAPLEIVKGLGFFYSQRFIFGEQTYSLHNVENKKIRDQFQDARIHFVLNCGSYSCPVLRPELPTGAALDPFLASAAAEFVSDEKNVQISHEDKTVTLNEIFDWFEKDFLNDMRRRGLPSSNGLVDYVASVAPAKLRAELSRASNYEVAFAAYDWSINDTREPHE